MGGSILPAVWMMKSDKPLTHHSKMKLTLLISLFGTFAAATVQAEMRDAATHEQLALIHRSASQNDPARKFAPTQGPDPSVARPMKSLISESEIVCFNGMATLVPKRAILQTPKNMADRLKYVAGAKLLSWADFYAANRGWITTVEVSRIQAGGNAPIAEDTRKHMSKSANLIVATYQAGPISVSPLKIPEDKPTTAGKTATVNPTTKNQKL
jgi:hypothetical protein